MLGLYIHIPFCKRKCFYCDFVSIGYSETEADFYIDALEKESKLYKDVFIDTVYIGGGTPSILSLNQLARLIKIIKSNFNLSGLKEFSVELNPESASTGKLKFLHDENVTRLSFGLQSDNDDVLKYLGRQHSFTDFCKSYENALKTGFKNINIDLIYGIEKQSLENWQNTLDKTINFDSAHISLYPLTIEQNTVFYIKNIITDEQLQQQMYYHACTALKNSGFEHYEISNWAKDKKYSLHNKLYWQNIEYIGLGAGAASYYCRHRFKNLPGIKEYIKNINENKSSIIEKEYIDENLRNAETIMLGLRLCEGVDLKFFESKKEFLEKYILQGMMTLKNNKVSLTEKALFVSNSVIADFI